MFQTEGLACEEAQRQVRGMVRRSLWSPVEWHRGVLGGEADPG